MRALKFKDYFFQIILIVLSVLLALFINNYRENVKINKTKKIALASINIEIKNNHKILTEWHSVHKSIFENTKKFLDLPEDSLKIIFFKNGGFNAALLFNNQNLIEEMVNTISWETAKSTGIISQFEYGKVEKLTKIYELQNTIVKKTINDIIDLYQDRQTHEPKNISVTLQLFKILFHQIVAQENLLLQLYEEHINKNE